MQLHIIYFIVLLNFMTAFTLVNSSAQDYNADTVRKLKVIISSSDDDSTIFATYIDLHNIHFKSHPEISREYSYKMLSLSEKMKDTQRIVKSYLALRRCYIKSRTYDSVFRYNGKVLYLANEIKDYNLLFLANVNMATDMMDSEQAGEATLSYLKDAMSYAKVNERTEQEANINKLYGHYYAAKNNYGLSIPYFEKAIEMYGGINDEKNFYRTKLFLTEAMLEINPTNETLTSLLELVHYYEQGNNQYIQAYLRGLIGQYFVLQGDALKALENYKYARQLFKEHNNMTDYALAGIDVALFLMDDKKPDEAYKYIKESKEILNRVGYEPGIILADIAMARYYSEKGKYKNADELFGKLQNEASSKPNDNLKYLQALAVHYYNQGKEVQKDSVLFSFYKNLIKEKETAAAVKMLRYFLANNKEIDTNGKYIQNMLTSHKDVFKIKSYFHKESFNGYILPDSFISDSIGTGSDMANPDIFTQNLRELEITHALINKELADKNLALEEKNHRITKIVSITGLLLAGGIIILLAMLIRNIQKNKKRIEKEKNRAEQDKQTIESLQSHINHLVENNLKKVKSLVDTAQAEDGSEKAFDNLKRRISVIIQAHTFLKQKSDKMVVDENIKFDLEQYIRGTWEKQQMVFGIEDEIQLVLETNNIRLIGDKAINLCILISELMINSIKYAFAEEENEEDKAISILIENKEDNTIVMTYKDNGKGLPAEYKEGRGTSLIKQIVQSLKADYSITNDNGFRFALNFKRIID